MLEALLRGIFDEERVTQTSAAKAIAAVYKGNEDIRNVLQESLRTTLDVSVAAALIEGLTLGWPSWSELPAHDDAALRSKDPTLRLVGIAGRVETGRANNEDRDALIQLLSEFPRIDYWDQPQARELLIRRWPDDDVVITKSLECLEERGPVRV